MAVMNDKLDGERGEESPEIKVVDRRSFTSDGQRRGDQAPPAPASQETQPPPVRDAGGPVKGPGFTMHDDPEGDAARAERDAAFLNLCVSIYESGCLHLGLDQQGGDTGEKPNLEGARGAISMIEMLKRKTDGNLSTEERQILERLLADLQMAYVRKAPDASS